MKRERSERGAVVDPSGRPPRPIATASPHGSSAVIDAETSALWALVAWRFLRHHAVSAADLMMTAPPYAAVEPAMDSFRALYCVRCHEYNCNLHGCGQRLPRSRDAAAAAQGTGTGTGTSARARAKDKDMSQQDALDDACPEGVDPPPEANPCGPDCWRMRGLRDGGAFLVFHAKSVRLVAELAMNKRLNVAEEAKQMCLEAEEDAAAAREALERAEPAAKFMDDAPVRKSARGKPAAGGRPGGRAPKVRAPRRRPGPGPGASARAGNIGRRI